MAVATEKDKLIKRRSCVKGQLTVYKNYLENIQKIDVTKLSSQQISELRLRLSKLERNLAAFDSLQTEIEILCENSDDQLAERENIESIFFNLMSSTQSIIEEASVIANRRQSLVNTAANQSCSFDHSLTSNNISLPAIRLPIFDGCYSKWLEYRDTYLSLIHNNNSINSINKFHYLRSSLEAGAALVIKSIEFCADNYTAAWNLLCDRYNNKRLLINNHIKALFSIDIMVRESDTSLRFIIDHVTKNLSALKNLGQPVNHWDSLIIYLVATKLDNFTSRKWEEFRGSLDDIPTLQEFINFLRNRADFLETVKHNKNPKNERVSNFVSSGQTSSNYSSRLQCMVCKQSHRLHECPRFISMTLEERNNLVSKNKLCANCLSTGHYASTCRYSPCKTCRYKHNTLLHRPKLQSNNNGMNNNNSQSLIVSQVQSGDQLCAGGVPEPVSLSTIEATAAAIPAQLILLSTALVQVVNNSGEVFVVRILLDSGSQISLITDCLRAKLGLCSVKNEQPLNVSGVGNTKLCILERCNFVIRSMKGNFSSEVNSMVVQRITGMLPNVNVNTQTLNIPKGILENLADPQFYKPAEVDILIGADLYWEIICGKQVKLGKGKPTLQSSRLGWLISGPLSEQGPGNNAVSCQLNLELNDIVKKFWTIEELPSSKLVKNSEEEFCENHFVENTYRLQDGRFCVKIPFHTSPDILGDSLQMAKRRFYNLEKRFDKQPLLKESYVKFINEYKELGHMSPSRKIDAAYYLPHHPVLREKSETTKLRVVFDASAKTTTGRSLNDIQGVGAVVQDDLFSILLRFRQHSFVTTADIEKMYRQVIVSEDQRQWQMIVWRENPNESLQYFKLNRLTYGLASAPFLSTRCLFQLAQECSDENAKTVLEHCFYVDDLLFGFDNESELEKTIKTVVKILDSAGFKLRKFRTNSNVKIQESNSSEDQIFSDLKATTSTLGLIWSPLSDNFMFPVNINADKIITKRTLLSIIAKIFDPLGLLSIFIIKAKLIMQSLWKCKLDWDDKVPEDIMVMWLTFVKTINSLTCVNVPRHVSCKGPVNIEIHVFSDASQAAYGACAYVRSVDQKGKVFVKLLCAKSRVAPIKSVTIPKLELCGALLAAEMSAKVRQALRCEVAKCVHWSDSMVVIGWIHTSSSKKLDVFVANRVNEIKKLTKNYEWRYVPTRDNPADLVSRGVEIFDEKVSNFWWGGPEFLTQDESQWPTKRYNSQRLNNENEVNLLHNIVDKCDKNEVIDFSRYSRLTVLKRIIGYVLRFISSCRNPKNKIVSLALTVEELNNSIVALAKLAQFESFNTELQSLKNNQLISKKSRILSLNPFLDKSGVIRVGGRIQNSNFTYDKKHPILLDSKHRLSILIFENEHKILMHAGPQLLLASVREQFWIVNARILARSIPNKCKVCKRFRGKTLQPMMGNLPNQRLIPGIPFEATGADLAGPFLITDRKGRGCKISKCYLCIFVCFATKALHLEAVSDLSKEAFILSLKRFISRRGKPKYIFCDNGTNFVGTKNELNKFILSNKEHLARVGSDEGITFCFSPAYAPNFGGLWEAGVKSAKFHLRRILGDRHLTFEELATLFSQVEAILNSRPICPMSSDPNDLCPLTPGHFLIGKPMTSFPTHQLTDININRLDRYKQLEQMRQHFWSRWHNEYIAELQHRSKWQQQHCNLKLGDLVIIKEDNLPPLKWRMGRVHALFPGPDGIPRVADINTGNGILRRALSRLCPLHLEDCGAQELKTSPSSTGEDVRA